MKNYKLIEEKYLENEQSKALVLEHNKTKAKVFIMPNEDDNKVFGIGFRTPPKSSNGVCHIIEHCVLNGSKKYRTREPFMDMVKGSLNTFLNAMTYPDKTIYPVASRNDQDFRNLTDLYLDAVFNPKVKEDEKIFKQEGWRYHLEDDKLSYKGVVYNEMRGSMSSLESQVYRSIYKELQPDTIYAFNSGGDPYQIPSLSYGEFLDYYKEFYHPTNSYIFLYGNMDYEEYLDYIDRDYLSNYEYRDVHSHLEKQEYFGETRYSVNYLNTAKEMKTNEAFISYTTLLGDAEDSKIRILSNLVSSILINNESSPIKQRLMASGILDVIFSASQNTNQCSFSLVAKNINPENRDEFVNIIQAANYTAIITDKNGKTVEREWSNSNRFLNGKADKPEGINVIGGKTGTTQAAGYCLVMLSKNEQEQEIVSVVLKAGGPSDLYLLTREILQEFNN